MMEGTLGKDSELSVVVLDRKVCVVLLLCLPQKIYGNRICGRAPRVIKNSIWIIQYFYH